MDPTNRLTNYEIDLPPFPKLESTDSHSKTTSKETESSINITYIPGRSTETIEKNIDKIKSQEGKNGFIVIDAEPNGFQIIQIENKQVRRSPERYSLEELSEHLKTCGNDKSIDDLYKKLSEFNTLVTKYSRKQSQSMNENSNQIVLSHTTDTKIESFNRTLQKVLWAAVNLELGHSEEIKESNETFTIARDKTGEIEVLQHIKVLGKGNYAIATKVESVVSGFSGVMKTLKPMHHLTKENEKLALIESDVLLRNIREKYQCQDLSRIGLINPPLKVINLAKNEIILLEQEYLGTCYNLNSILKSSTSPSTLNNDRTPQESAQEFMINLNSMEQLFKGFESLGSIDIYPTDCKPQNLFLTGTPALDPKTAIPQMTYVMGDISGNINKTQLDSTIHNLFMIPKEYLAQQPLSEKGFKCYRKILESYKFPNMSALIKEATAEANKLKYELISNLAKEQGKTLAVTDTNALDLFFDTLDKQSKDNINKEVDQFQENHIHVLRETATIQSFNQAVKEAKIPLNPAEINPIRNLLRAHSKNLNDALSAAKLPYTKELSCESDNLEIDKIIKDIYIARLKGESTSVLLAELTELRMKKAIFSFGMTLGLLFEIGDEDLKMISDEQKTSDEVTDLDQQIAGQMAFFSGEENDDKINALYSGVTAPLLMEVIKPMLKPNYKDRPSIEKLEKEFQGIKNIILKTSLKNLEELLTAAHSPQSSSKEEEK